MYFKVDDTIVVLVGFVESARQEIVRHRTMGKPVDAGLLLEDEFKRAHELHKAFGRLFQELAAAKGMARRPRQGQDLFGDLCWVGDCFGDLIGDCGCGEKLGLDFQLGSGSQALGWRWVGDFIGD